MFGWVVPFRRDQQFPPRARETRSRGPRPRSTRFFPAPFGVVVPVDSCLGQAGGVLGPCRSAASHRECPSTRQVIPADLPRPLHVGPAKRRRKFGNAKPLRIPKCTTDPSTCENFVRGMVRKLRRCGRIRRTDAAWCPSDEIDHDSACHPSFERCLANGNSSAGSLAVNGRQDGVAELPLVRSTSCRLGTELIVTHVLVEHTASRPPSSQRRTISSAC